MLNIRTAFHFSQLTHYWYFLLDQQPEVCWHHSTTSHQRRTCIRIFLGTDPEQPVLLCLEHELKAFFPIDWMFQIDKLYHETIYMTYSTLISSIRPFECNFRRMKTWVAFYLRNGFESLAISFLFFQDRNFPDARWIDHHASNLGWRCPNGPNHFRNLSKTHNVGPAKMK